MGDNYANLTLSQIEYCSDDPEYLDYLNLKGSKMKEAKGNMWDMSCDAICITTNGFVKSNGECVMGRGCAKEAAEYFPEIPKILGGKIKKNGNTVQTIRHFEGVAIVAFPVKPIVNSCKPYSRNVVTHMQDKYKVGDVVPGWACKADAEIIVRSLKQLITLADKNGWKNILIPRVGCGYGELDWKDVSSVLHKELDDRFTTVGENNDKCKSKF